MAIANRISAVIPPATVTDVITKITDAFNLLKPYLLATLTAEEIDGLAKLGEKSEPFAGKGIEFAKTNSNLVPSWVNIPEAEKDFAYFEALRPIDILLDQFAKQVASSKIEAGAEVLDAVNDFYKSVQQAHESGVLTATPIYDEMKKRYAANGRRPNKGNGNLSK
jgi:hypothetical protein